MPCHPPMPKQLNIIFDFDGTLADTLELALKFGQENLERFHLKEISREDFRNHSLKEVLKLIDLRWYRIPRYVLELKKYIQSNLDHVVVFPGIVGAITTLKKQSLKLFVMSSNSSENIMGVLKRFDLENCFETIVSDSSLFGKHTVLERLFKKYSLEQKSSLYIGDEVRDIEACKRFGVEMIAVSWGWDSALRLQKTGHKKIVNSVEELLANFRR